MAEARPLRIYTDGACSGNPGPGGWAWASSWEHQGSGGEVETTNNRMELTAVRRAIADNPGRLVVVMDSTYVKDGLEKWSANWKRNGWRTKDKKPVKNREIWEPLVDLVDERGSEVVFEWVKGHSGDVMNDLVDELAVVQRDAHKPGGPAAAPGSGGGARLASFTPDDERDQRRQRDGRIPAGHLLVVLGQRAPEVSGATADKVRSDLVEVLAGLARVHPDLVVVTGLREGTERLAAEAAIRADLPYVAVLPFPDAHLRAASSDQARVLDLIGRARQVVLLEKKTPKDRSAFAGSLARRDAWLARVADEAILVWDEVDERFAKLHRGLDSHLGPDLLVLHP